MTNRLKIPSIGIVGGAGPMAGVLLFQKIVQICQQKYGCKVDADFPAITLHSYPFLDMLQGVDAAKIKLLQKQVDECFFKLLQSGSRIVAIACNTLHEFLPQTLPDSIAFVHMIAETAKVLQNSQIQKAFVLASTTSVRCRLHTKYFECEYPEDELQVELQKLIDKILAGKQCKKDAEQLAELVNAQLKSKRTEKIAVVLGCTEFSIFNEEFPLQLNGLEAAFTVFDPNEVVAEQICKQVFNNKCNE